MAPRRDWRRVSAASATLSAGALVFFSAGIGPASADTQSAASTSGCPLGKLLCGVLGQGSSSSPTPPPKSSGGGTASKPATKPKSQPKPKAVAKPAPAHHQSSGGSGGAAGAPPPLPPGGGAPSIPAPQSAQGPTLPDVGAQDPLVVPEAGGRSPSARLVADSSSDDGTIPPLLVATASGLIGTVAALNLSVRRRRREH